MLDIFAAYAMDENAEINGVWQPLGDAEFLIARANNRNFARALAARVEKEQEKLDRQDEAADKLSDEIWASVYAETVLLDWRGVTYKGKPLPYSKANACKVLAHRDFRREITKLAESLDAYRAKVEETQIKNS
jgi:hypothetical protein